MSGPNSLAHCRVPKEEVPGGIGAYYHQACMKFCCYDGKLYKDNHQVTRSKPPSSWMNFDQELYEECMKLAYILSQTLPCDAIAYLAVICERSQFTTDLSPQVFVVGYSIGEEFWFSGEPSSLLKDMKEIPELGDSKVIFEKTNVVVMKDDVTGFPVTYYKPNSIEAKCVSLLDATKLGWQSPTLIQILVFNYCKSDESISFLLSSLEGWKKGISTGVMDNIGKLEKLFKSEDFVNKKCHVIIKRVTPWPETETEDGKYQSKERHKKIIQSWKNISGHTRSLGWDKFISQKDGEKKNHTIMIQQLSKVISALVSNNYKLIKFDKN